VAIFLDSLLRLLNSNLQFHGWVRSRCLIYPFIRIYEFSCDCRTIIFVTDVYYTFKSHRIILYFQKSSYNKIKTKPEGVLIQSCVQTLTIIYSNSQKRKESLQMVEHPGGTSRFSCGSLFCFYPRQIDHYPSCRCCREPCLVHCPFLTAIECGRKKDKRVKSIAAFNCSAVALAIQVYSTTSGFFF
jgi:hypothetical protein